MIKRVIRTGAIFASIFMLFLGVNRPKIGDFEPKNGPFSGISVEMAPKLSDFPSFEVKNVQKVAIENTESPESGFQEGEMDNCTSEDLKNDLRGLEVQQSVDWAYTDDDIELLALLCIAEAENQSELGKRLVIDTVLNRMDDDRFPNSVTGVIFQDEPRQYTSCWNGRIDKVEVCAHDIELVVTELESRTNLDVLYFNTGGFNDWSTPVCHVDDHYFSK